MILSQKKQAELIEAMEETSRKKGQWKDILGRLVRNKLGLIGLIIVAVLLILVIFANVFAKYDYSMQDFGNRFAYPSWQHPMGTDNFGRDLWSRLLFGGRISLLVAVLAVIISTFMGIVIGSSAGYFGGKTDAVITRITDTLMAIPGLLFAIAISAALGSGPVKTAIAVSISSIPHASRIIRSTVMSIKGNEFVEAAKATGSRNFRIIFKHILPNTIAPLIVSSTLQIGGCIMAISGLSFIGLGVQPPTPEWGSILAAGRTYIRDFWPIVVFPSLFIMLTLFGFNLFGDALRDALDPRLKDQGMPHMSLLNIKGLTIHYIKRGSTIRAVNGIDLSIGVGQTVGLVGETGAGKTTTALGVLRLIQEPPGKVIGGEIFFEGKDLLKANDTEMRKIRGNDISMIFQDPMTALNPIMRVGDQIAEVIFQHGNCSKTEAARRSLKMLETVGIRAERSTEYPHQFSGGMKQRVIIAIALACQPKLLIADEPTTALDVTIQAQVLEMINDLKAMFNTSMLLITHDLGIVAETCDEVAIMYAGQIIEYGSLVHIFDNPKHPYTKGLFGSLPSLNKDVERLSPIRGLMPDPANLPSGCKFHTRCDHVCEDCKVTEPAFKEIEPGHSVRCLRVERGEI